MDSVSAGYERSLLAAAQAGDELAFWRLVSHHRPGLELYCGLMLGCPRQAHDAVHETLLRGWRDLHRVAPSGSARIWLYRLATHICLENLDATDEVRGRRSFDGMKDGPSP